MHLKPEDFGLKKETFEHSVNMLIQLYGYDKSIHYTLSPALAEELDHLGRLLASDINAVLNRPEDYDNAKD